MFLLDLRFFSPLMSSQAKNKPGHGITCFWGRYENHKDKLVSASSQKQAPSGFAFKAPWRARWLATAATLLAIFVCPAAVNAWPEQSSVSHKEDENGQYAIVDFTKENCKISGPLAERLYLYDCFAYLSGDARSISITYLIESNDVQIKKRVKCKLSDNPAQALIFHPRYKDNQFRKSLASAVKRRNVVQDSSGGYDASITIDGWWLRSNKFVNMGLMDARADDVCGLSYYFKPSNELIRAIQRLNP